MLLFLLQAMEADDAELMELMDDCESSGDHQYEQRDATTPTHIQQTQPEQMGTAQKNPPQSESSQEWNKPIMQVAEGESEGSITQYRGDEKKPEGQKCEDEKAGGSENGSEMMQEECEGGGWGQRVCHTHERTIPMQDTVDELDITEEGKDGETVMEELFFLVSSLIFECFSAQVWRLCCVIWSSILSAGWS